tara:strand:+ start:81 stop:272 length:192 start_codon:yes stop_codon:yes gene_type:complete
MSTLTIEEAKDLYYNNSGKELMRKLRKKGVKTYNTFLVFLKENDVKLKGSGNRAKRKLNLKKI